MSLENVPLEIIMAIISIFVTGFIAFYGIYRTNKNTKLVVKYAHKPYIMPIMGKSKKSEEIKSIHIKNAGNGVATNIECTIRIDKSASGQKTKSVSRSIMTGDKDSHNMEIKLNEDLEFTLDAVYYDLANEKYHTTEKYRYTYKPEPEWHRIS